jgi:hypothetical protein
MNFFIATSLGNAAGAAAARAIGLHSNDERAAP